MLEEKIEAIHWLDLVNEQFEWPTAQEVQRWFTRQFERKCLIPSAQLDRFRSTLFYVREQLAALHFGTEPLLEVLKARLEHIVPSFTISAPQQVLSTSERHFPLLHSKLGGEDDAALLLAIEETVLLQFAAFLSGALAQPESGKLLRCEGLYRDTKRMPGSAASTRDSTERHWRKEIEILRMDDNMAAQALERCGDFFIANSKSRFCSESCRFRTFQLTKQLTDPEYLAEKQRRYRKRKTHNPAARKQL